MLPASRTPLVLSRRALIIGSVQVSMGWSSQSGAQEALSNADRGFLAWDIQVEVQQQDMGQLARRRGQTAEVRTLGNYLVGQHQAAEAKLHRLAQRLGVTLSRSLSSTHLGVQRHYAAVPAEQFDRAFLRHEIGDYSYFLRHFEAASRTGNPDIRQYAEAELPRIREGQQRVETLLGRLQSDGHFH